LASDGRVLADGTVRLPEQWYWFRGDATRPEQDVVDTIEYVGRLSERWEGTDLGCDQCEVVVEAQIRVVENPSGWTYEDQRDNVFAFDTLNPEGSFFEEFGMVVVRATLNPRGQPIVQWADYARGTWKPDSEVPGQVPVGVSWASTDLLGDCY
jgi:hypothetical protein